MSTKARKPFVVRGFNVTSGDQFSSIGRMGGQVDYVEVVVDRQHDAVAEMLAHSTIGKMSARKLVGMNGNVVTHGTMPDVDDVKEVYVIDLTIVTNAKSVVDVRPIRTEVRDVLKTWAEKSRVAGRRGWRSSAIKTPTYEFDKTLGFVVIRTQIVLGTAIFYNWDTATVNVNFDLAMEQEDLRSLHRELSRVSHTQGFYSHMKYRHSEIGDGEV